MIQEITILAPRLEKTVCCQEKKGLMLEKIQCFRHINKWQSFLSNQSKKAMSQYIIENKWPLDIDMFNFSTKSMAGEGDLTEMVSSDTVN